MTKGIKIVLHLVNVVKIQVKRKNFEMFATKYTEQLDRYDSDHVPPKKRSYDRYRKTFFFLVTQYTKYRVSLATVIFRAPFYCVWRLLGNAKCVFQHAVRPAFIIKQNNGHKN